MGTICEKLFKSFEMLSGAASGEKLRKNSLAPAGSKGDETTCQGRCNRKDAAERGTGWCRCSSGLLLRCDEAFIVTDNVR